MKRVDPVVILLIAALLSMFAIQLLATSTARAQSGNHGDGHAAHHAEYSDWKMPGTQTPCCSPQVVNDDGSVTGDCRPVRAKQDLEGNWEALVDGAWLSIPRSKVLPFHAKDGRSHYCGMLGVTFCFVPAEVRS